MVWNGFSFIRVPFKGIAGLNAIAPGALYQSVQVYVPSSLLDSGYVRVCDSFRVAFYEK